MPPVMLEVFPRRGEKSWHYKKNYEFLDVYWRLRSTAAVAWHFEINESNIRSVVKKRKKNICEAVAAGMQSGMKTLHILWNKFLPHIESEAFMRVQDCYKKDIPI